MEHVEAVEETLQNKKHKKTPWDDELYTTVDLYGLGSTSPDMTMDPVAKPANKEMPP